MPFADIIISLLSITFHVRPTVFRLSFAHIDTAATIDY